MMNVVSSTMADNQTLEEPATPRTADKILNTVFARGSQFTEEHFSFIINHIDQGIDPPDILKLLNKTFSLEQSILAVEEAVSYIRRNIKREKLLRRRAVRYAWCTTPRLLPAPKPRLDTRETILGSEMVFSNEMKAFMIWNYLRGNQKPTVLTALNAQFRTGFELTSVKLGLTHLMKNEKAVEMLTEEAKRFEWWKPPHKPGTRDAKREQRAARLRAAKARLTGNAKGYKQWKGANEGAESEGWSPPESATWKGQMQAYAAPPDDILSPPIKIEESDTDDENLSEDVLAYFNQTAKTLAGSPSERNMPNSSPHFVTRSFKGENAADDTLLTFSNEDVDLCNGDPNQDTIATVPEYRI